MRRKDTPESLAVRADYAAVNPTCEVGDLMRLIGVTKPAYRFRDVETHHIVGGAGRLDVVSNLIRVHWFYHLWIEEHVHEGRLLCLIAKSLKSPPEIDPDEFATCSRKRLVGWVENNPPSHAALRPLYDNLLRMLREQYPEEE